MRTQEELKMYLNYLKGIEEMLIKRSERYIEQFKETKYSTNLFFIMESLVNVQTRIQIIEWVLGKESPIVYFTKDKK